MFPLLKKTGLHHALTSTASAEKKQKDRKNPQNGTVHVGVAKLSAPDRVQTACLKRITRKACNMRITGQVGSNSHHLIAKLARAAFA